MTCMHKQWISCCVLWTSHCKGHDFETDFVVYRCINIVYFVVKWLAMCDIVNLSIAF